MDERLLCGMSSDSRERKAAPHGDSFKDSLESRAPIRWVREHSLVNFHIQPADAHPTELPCMSGSGGNRHLPKKAVNVRYLDTLTFGWLNRATAPRLKRSVGRSVASKGCSWPIAADRI